MDMSFDIFQIYHQYCDIMSRAYANDKDGCGLEDEFERSRISREALAQLLLVVESGVGTSVSILEEVCKLMWRLDLMADFSEFSRFYDFVFFICRENRQKSISVSRAIAAWKLVLTGRFRLLNQWCNFIEKNQRHNISEDTWRQVLAFSRCVHENLEGYDPEGAWPVLIDEFVEHMYRIRGSQGSPNLFCCTCGDSEPQQCEDALPGLKTFPGSKRKSCGNLNMEHESSDGYDLNMGHESPDWYDLNMEQESSDRHACTARAASSKRRKDDCIDFVKQSSPFGCYKSPCAVEGCLSKGFAGLLSSRSCLQFDQDRRVSYT